jgi:signal peptidase II
VEESAAGDEAFLKFRAGNLMAQRTETRRGFKQYRPEGKMPRMKLISKLLTLAVVSFGCIGCDQVTKTAAQTSLQGREPIALLYGMIRLVYVENSGAFMSLGAGLPVAFRFWIFIVLTAVGLALLLSVSLRAKALRFSQALALGLIIGGGCGNLIDRVNLGFVRDFMQIGIGHLLTGVFNVADAAITAGGLLFLAAALLRARTARKSSNPSAGSAD